jgi:hypothetical protein
MMTLLHDQLLRNFEHVHQGEFGSIGKSNGDGWCEACQAYLTTVIESPVFVGFDLSRAEILKAVAQRRKERECLKKK